MNKITFVIPSRNNLEFLQLAYKSIRNLDTKHEILVLNDASTDGTQEWIDSLNDKDLITHHNPGPERIGIVGMFEGFGSEDLQIADRKKILNDSTLEEE